jgi:hypothetical protein
MHIFMSLQKGCYTINRNVHSVCRATGLALERNGEMVVSSDSIFLLTSYFFQLIFFKRDKLKWVLHPGKRLDFFKYIFYLTFFVNSNTAYQPSDFTK